jgi:hypothetical protein
MLDIGGPTTVEYMSRTAALLCCPRIVSTLAFPGCERPDPGVTSGENRAGALCNTNRAARRTSSCSEAGAGSAGTRSPSRARTPLVLGT